MTEVTNQLQIGAASVDITPPAGVTLVGFKPRTAAGVGHKLRAEALVVRGQDGGAWALVTSDVIGYPAKLVAELRRKAAEASGLQPEAIMFSGTHTHSAPATIMFGGEELGETDRQYLATLQDRLAQVVADAAAAARPGLFEIAWAEAPDLGSNRRIEQPDGTWSNEWNDPEGKHPGPFDPTVLVVAVRRPDGTRDALLVNYGVHPVVLGPSSLNVSADYPGYLKDALEQAGHATIAMFAQAGGANINPRDCLNTDGEHARQVGEALADAVIAALDRLEPISAGPVAAHREPWNIVRTRDAMKRTDRPGSKTGDTLSTEVQALRAGDLAVVSLPGELFTEFNAVIREASPLPHTAVVSLANDYIGYLPTDEAQKQGAYETKMAPAEPLEAELVNRARTALEAVAG